MSELAAASTFLASFLPPTTSNTILTTFTKNLESLLSQRYSHHWHPSDPERGSAYRALIRGGGSLDSSIVVAANRAGFNSSEIDKFLGGSEGRVWLGQRWTLWVDPGCVSLRIERTGGSAAAGREGQFIEIYGSLPASLRSHAVGLDSVEKGSSSVNITTTTPTLTSRDLDTHAAFSTTISPPSLHDQHLLSPTKRSSRAIQILRPPQSSSLSPSPPLLLHPQPSMCASPFITPPTPSRPISPSAMDVFSSSRSPSPVPALNYNLSSNLTLAAPNPISRSMHSGRRSVSGSSSVDDESSGRGSSASGSDGEDGIFSSTESMASSFTSAGSRRSTSGNLWSEGVGEFKYPPSSTSLNRGGPFTFPPITQHESALNHLAQPPRSHSSMSNRSIHNSPSKSYHNNQGSSSYPRSVPSSPSKSRRRGARGGSITSHPNGTGPEHESHSSITSITSITSTASARPTREQALAGHLTEHSGGKVGVLGGGVLLGLASTNRMSNAMGGGGGAGGERRKTRERSRRIQPSTVPFPVAGGYQVGGVF